MNFEDLNDLVPFVKGGKKHFFTAQIYPGVELSMPGKHALDTNPIGGDGVVLVSDEHVEWAKKPFTHVDLFVDAELKVDKSLFWDAYVDVINGLDPAQFDFRRKDFDGIHPMTFLYASQVLSMIEHRRYAHHAASGGGKYLPARFTLGIAEGLWSAAQAASFQRRGRVGVDILEHKYGKTSLSKVLLGDK